MSGFSVEWLDLREAADHRARDKRLLRIAANWVDDLKTPDRVIVDLGSGTGSTLRALKKANPKMSSIHWRLVDNDCTVLAEAIRRHAKENLIEKHILDLSETQKLPLENVCLVTTSALLDLVSADFIRELSDRIKRAADFHSVGLYSALNYDGHIEWTPFHPLDGRILDSFNSDQRRDKGFGLALGPDAAEFLQTQFEASEFEVFSASSPWRLNPSDETLTNSLIDGIATVALQSSSLTNSEVMEWKEFRMKNVKSCSCFVGHVDVLVLSKKPLD